MSDFIHLHVHSHYSLLDALPKVDELVKAAKNRGFSALALTDHGNMYGAIEFYEECEKQGIKPILGVEVYLAPNSYLDREATESHFRLVLLAMDNVGYRNLVELISIGQTAGLHFKPRIDKELLRKYHAGIVALSGGLDGEVAQLLRKENNLVKAKKVALDFQEIFGQENFYLELMDLPAKEGQVELNADLIELSEETGIPLVVTRDVHYLKAEDAEAQDVLTCIRDGKTVDDVNRVSLVGIDYSLCRGSEVEERFTHIKSALDNTAKIAARASVKLNLNKWHFPQIDLPLNKSADDYLRDLVYERLAKLIEITEAVKERVDYELGIIKTKGYSPYFIVVADYVNYARANGIVETTRGSGAGSIVAYAMGITTVNPLYFKLPFERFLNPYRPSAPDIDADFADDRRDDMIAYVTQKYGADKVAQIITFGTMMARGAIRDVGRALGYPYSFCDQVSKMIPIGAQGFQMTLDKALDLEKDFMDLYKKNPQVQKLIDLAKKVEGCARHTSIHAAGVVIAPTPLTDFTPVQYETGGTKITTQYEMHSVEAAGLLKMDFLGIRNLSILGRAVEIVEKTTGQKIDIFQIPWDDKKTYDMLARGETNSVFQLSGSGMTRYLKELKPTSIFDITAMVALFRPGPMEQIPEYIRRKHHPETVEYLDKRMEEYLDQSLGLIVYQDDVLLTSIHLAGYNWEEADKFRKAMGKKIPEEMAKQKEKFIKGCREYGKLPEAKIHLLWEMIEPFAAYGFNKAHAASYGVVAYQTAYMKANYPVQYMTAVLIAESGDMDKVPEIIRECERMGIRVLPPDINESLKNFAMIGWENGGTAHIRFGLSGVKNLGEHIAEVIYRERKNNGRYKNLEDFLQRVQDKDLNKKSLESLIKCGALDSFGTDRGELLANIDNLLGFTKNFGEQKKTLQNSLFAGTGIDFTSKLNIISAPQATQEEKLNWEKELLGVYVTAHPFTVFMQGLSDCLTPIKQLSSYRRNEWVVVGGIVDSVKKKITRSGSPMSFVAIEDTTDRLELLVFPKVYEATKEIWTEGKMVVVVGKTSEQEGDDKLFVEKAYALSMENMHSLSTQLNTKATASIRQYVNKSLEKTFDISLKATTLKAKADEIKNVLKQFPGEETVYLLVNNKKIKTSYKVKSCPELENQIQNLIAS
jgi:DNA polymerase-3 subunit alpha